MKHGMLPPRQGLYDFANEHDACGVGFIANVKGKKSHSIIDHGLRILVNLTHRSAVGADPLAGDGAGILMQIPDAFLREECATLGISLPEPGEYVFVLEGTADTVAGSIELTAKVTDVGILPAKLDNVFIVNFS